MKYLFVLLFALILISCSDDSTSNNPPVDKVEKELLGNWTGINVVGKDSIFYTVNFADSDNGPKVTGQLYALIVNSNGSSSTKTITQSGTMYYTYNKPNLILRFISDSDNNGFIGTISQDGNSIVGEVSPSDLMTGEIKKYLITLTK